MLNLITKDLFVKNIYTIIKAWYALKRIMLFLIKLYVTQKTHLIRRNSIEILWQLVN